MSVTTRRNRLRPFGVVFLAGVFLLLAGMVFVPTVGASFHGQTGFVNPVTWAVAGGFGSWDTEYTKALVVIALAPLLVMVAGSVLVIQYYRRSDPVDVAAVLLANGRSMKRLRPKKVMETNKRLGCPNTPGVAFGYTVAGNTPIRGTYEDSCTVIAGPRRQKTRTVVIPNVLLAPGPVLVTSVRPDVVAHTVMERGALGRVWLFDPEGQAKTHRAFRAWWNPLAEIHTLADARDIAQSFSDAAYSRDKQNSSDSFFPMKSVDLLAYYLFAAARSGRPITRVATWLKNEQDDTPAHIIQGEHSEIAASIRALSETTPTTRSGIYANALGAMSFLDSPELLAWITPSEDFPEFTPKQFVSSARDTLYLLSSESGSAAPLVTALTAQIIKHAEMAAGETATGRLGTPLVMVLDEAANICRLGDLPGKYSFWGGAGIIPISIFQSFEQGTSVWGDNGFTQLWNASTIRVFGGGSASSRFLAGLVEEIGDYEYEKTTHSRTTTGSTTQHHKERESIFDAGELVALPDLRMLVFANGVRPMLARMRPFDRDRKLRREIKRAHKKAEQRE